MSGPQICVKDRQGIWCAAVGEPNESDGGVETRCGVFITLPHGHELRRPTCPSCREIVKKERGE